jgi:hypothetical protein
MAKDAKGHGSDARGAHSSGVDQIGKSIPISPKAVKIIAKNATSGFSVTPSGKVPTTGFQVAVRGRTESEPLDLKNVAAQVAAHVAKNADVYKDPAMHIGGWNSPYTGKVHLEPSQNVSDRSTAVSLGVERNQHSIWDNKNMTDIKTGGTGKD